MTILSRFRWLWCVFFSFLLIHLSSAQSVKWAPRSSFYFTGGYSLTHELYHDLVQTVSDIHPSFSYNIRRTYPNNLNGMRLGFGGRFGASKSHYGYEIDFNQVFSKTRITPGLSVTRPEKIIVGFVDYTINPRDRLQWILAVGAVITTVPLTTKTIPPNEPSLSSSTTTSADPAIAGVVLYHINPMLAVKGVFIYKIAPYDTDIRGTLIPLIMINYYPNLFN